MDSNISSKFKNLDLEKLKTFYYIVKLKGIKRAASFLNISQPSMSRRVSELENFLGFKLLLRNSNGVELTRKGEELFSMFENTVLAFKELELKSFCGGKKKIRIASTYAVISYIISDVIYDYQKLNPHIRFELIAEDHSMDLTLHDIDIAIYCIDDRVKDNPIKSDLETQYLFSLEKKLFASPEYLKKYGEPKTAEDLKNHRLIAYANPEQHPYADVNWILNLGMPRGQMNQPWISSNSIDALVSFAEKGEGIVSGYTEMSNIKNSSLIQILPSVTCKPIKDYLIYPSFLKNDPEIINLVNYLKNYFDHVTEISTDG